MQAHTIIKWEPFSVEQYGNFNILIVKEIILKFFFLQEESQVHKNQERGCPIRTGFVFASPVFVPPECADGSGDRSCSAKPWGLVPEVSTNAAGFSLVAWLIV